MTHTPHIRIKHIIQSLPDALIVVDTQTHIKFLNPAAEALLGYTLNETKGKPLADILCLVDETTDEAIGCLGTKTMITGQDETAGSHALLIGRDALSELPVEVIARPLYTQQEISGALLSIHDVRLARFSRNQLSWNSSHDSLTGVYNRLDFEQQCHRLMITAKRDHNQHALLLVDLDHFRQLNELAGNHYGDECLIQVALLLKSQLRATDHLSRNHSDQFLILLSHCPLQRAQQIADNLRQQISQIQLDIDQGQWPVTACIGITMIHEQSPTHIIQLVHQAESAVFDAKQAGRNCVRIFDPQTHHQLNHELLALQAAMNSGQFQLFYQRIESPQGLTSHCEILTRYYDTSGKLKEPNSFLPLFEKSGLIVQLDLWVIQQLLEQLLERPQWMLEFSCIHINLSAYSFASSDFLESVESLLINYAIPHGLVCFEVSAASILNNLAHTEKVMSRLKQLGCLFAIDDLNANLSSFERLIKLPISSIKIDGQLIQRLQQSIYSRLLVESILALAKEAQLTVVAQQVEDFTVYDWLQHREVDYVQGFILHAPTALSASEPNISA